jgi:hypothetical protein
MAMPSSASTRHTAVHPDALLEIDALKQAEQFAVEVKNVDRFQTLNQLRALWPRQAKPPLVIAAPYITAQMGERCRDIDLYFADTAGNIYLRTPGLHLYVTGKLRPTDLTKAQAGRLTNPAGLRVVFAFLCNPQLLNATYREIATAACAVGDGWHNCRLGKRSLSPSAYGAQIRYLLLPVKHGCDRLSWDRVSLSLQENICSRGPTIGVHSQISSDIAQEFYRRKRQVFGTQYVSSCGLGFAMRANCLHRKFHPVRFLAGKKY